MPFLNLPYVETRAQHYWPLWVDIPRQAAITSLQGEWPLLARLLFGILSLTLHMCPPNLFRMHHIHFGGRGLSAIPQLGLCSNEGSASLAIVGGLTPPSRVQEFTR